MPADDPVRAWPKRGGEIRATLSLYAGKRFLNIRWWMETATGDEPSRKGTTIPQEALEDFSDALSAYPPPSASTALKSPLRA